MESQNLEQFLFYYDDSYRPFVTEHVYNTSNICRSYFSFSMLLQDCIL